MATPYPRFYSADCCWRSTLHNTYLKAQRILKQEGFNGTTVLDTLQSSAVISDVILNMKTISQSSKAPTFDHQILRERIIEIKTVLNQVPIHPVLTFSTNHESSYKKEIMVSNDTALILRVCIRSVQESDEGIKATPVDKLQATPSGMPQAMPQATPQGMPGATPPAILFQISKNSNFLNNLPQATPQASPQAIFKKIIALRPRPKAILKNYLPRGHASGYFSKKHMPFSYSVGYAPGSFEICKYLKSSITCNLHTYLRSSYLPAIIIPAITILTCNPQLPAIIIPAILTLTCNLHTYLRSSYLPAIIIPAIIILTCNPHTYLQSSHLARILILTCHHHTCHHHTYLQSSITCHHHTYLKSSITCHHHTYLKSSITCHHHTCNPHTYLQSSHLSAILILTCHHHTYLQSSITCHHHTYLRSSRPSFSHHLKELLTMLKLSAHCQRHLLMIRLENVRTNFIMATASSRL
ncbi:hypothetical protein T02_1888 [Trichinella nativa]|uniref:Uncharacterized protein n=1 Tax=Trichinella nativa TaxID=6335 RepID=A0A0V1LAN6_9BILA|nr:hypothetical protein T02_1888 [Trichinella nativa]